MRLCARLHVVTKEAAAHVLVADARRRRRRLGAPALALQRRGHEVVKVLLEERRRRLLDLRSERGGRDRETVTDRVTVIYVYIYRERGTRRHHTSSFS